MTTPTEATVFTAADAIIAAFAATDTDAYFAGFAPDATFIFHPEENRLNSRAEYEKIWQGWVESGWRVTSCESLDRKVQTFAGGAVFSHTVVTSITSPAGDDSYVERESIIFSTTPEGGLTAIHEHLSTVPDAVAEAVQKELAAQAGGAA